MCDLTKISQYHFHLSNLLTPLLIARGLTSPPPPNTLHIKLSGAVSLSTVRSIGLDSDRYAWQVLRMHDESYYIKGEKVLIIYADRDFAPLRQSDRIDYTIKQDKGDWVNGYFTVGHASIESAGLASYPPLPRTDLCNGTSDTALTVSFGEL